MFQDLDYATLERLSDAQALSHAWDIQGDYHNNLAQDITPELMSQCRDLDYLLRAHDRTNKPTRYKRVEEGAPNIFDSPHRELRLPKWSERPLDPVYYGCVRKFLTVKAFEPVWSSPSVETEMDEKKLAKYNHSLETGEPYVRGLRSYDTCTNVVSIIGANSCGCCEICSMTSRAKAFANIHAECLDALEKKLPVTFWTLTLSSKKHFKGKPDANGDKASYDRWSLPLEEMKYMLRLFRSRVYTAYGKATRIISCVELHKDGALHAHAVAIGADPSLVYGSTQDNNKFGSKVWTIEAPGRNEPWRYGRFEIALLPEDQMEACSKYIAKYASKAIDMSDSVREIAESRDGVKAWKRSQIGWCKPAAGLSRFMKMANENTDRLLSEGWAMFEKYPLDTHRRMMVERMIYRKIGRCIPRKVSVSVGLTRAMMEIDESMEMRTARKELNK